MIKRTLDIIIAILLPWKFVLSSDQRCLLQEGGSTDTFFVREDSAVGEEVGRIRVNGKLNNQLNNGK